MWWLGIVSLFYSLKDHTNHNQQDGLEVSEESMAVPHTHTHKDIFILTCVLRVLCLTDRITSAMNWECRLWHIEVDTWHHSFPWPFKANKHESQTMGVERQSSFAKFGTTESARGKSDQSVRSYRTIITCDYNAEHAPCDPVCSHHFKTNMCIPLRLQECAIKMF